ncbi:MAG: SAF domain-containing protein [Nocardioides sp.]
MPTLPNRVGRPLRTARLAVLRRRRPLAAVCTAIAVVAGLSAVSDRAPQTVPVTVAARDLAAGSRLTPGDLTTVEFRHGTEPSDVVTDLEGHVLAIRVSRGEPLTSTRLVGPALTEAQLGVQPGVQPGVQAVPVRLPDAGMVGLLSVGDVVDLVATDPQQGSADTVATAVPVLALPEADVVEAGGGSLPGRLVVIGLAPDEVGEVSAAAVARFLSFTWSGEGPSR